MPSPPYFTWQKLDKYNKPLFYHNLILRLNSLFTFPENSICLTNSCISFIFLPLNSSDGMHCMDKWYQQKEEKLNSAVRIRPFWSKLSLHEHLSSQLVSETAGTSESLEN